MRKYPLLTYWLFHALSGERKESMAENSAERINAQKRLRFSWILVVLKRGITNAAEESSRAGDHEPSQDTKTLSWGKDFEENVVTLQWVARASKWLPMETVQLAKISRTATWAPWFQPESRTLGNRRPFVARFGYQEATTLSRVSSSFN